MEERPVVLTPDLARRMLEAVEWFEAQPRNGRAPRLHGPAGDSFNRGVTWIQVTSTTLDNAGLQNGRLYPLNGASFGSAGTSIKVKQVNGYVLNTGKYLASWPSGKDSASGYTIYATSDQTGVDGIKTVCDNTAVRSWTEENGITKTVV